MQKKGHYRICIIFWGILVLNILFFNNALVEAYNNEILKLSAVMAERISQAGLQTVAVADFTDLQGNITELGRFLAEQVSVALAGSGRAIMVVDRTHIRTLLREHKLSETGLIDPATAKELGKMTGVEALITGTLTPFGDTVEITMKVLHTETARIIDASSQSLAKTKTFEELLERGIQTGPISSSGNTPSTTRPLSPQQAVDVNGFTFSLQTCQRNAGNVTCHILITNNGEDRKLEIMKQSNNAKTRIIDELGNEYVAKRLTLGNDSSEMSRVENRLVAGIPTKALLYFEGIVPEVQVAALVELSCYSGELFSSQFRTIPLSK